MPKKEYGPPELQPHMRLFSEELRQLIKEKIKTHQRYMNENNSLRFWAELLESLLNTQRHLMPEDYNQLGYAVARTYLFLGDLFALKELNDKYGDKNLYLKSVCTFGSGWSDHTLKAIQTLRFISSQVSSGKHPSFFVVELYGMLAYLYTIVRDQKNVQKHFFKAKNIAFRQRGGKKRIILSHAYPWALISQAYMLRERGIMSKALQHLNKTLFYLDKEENRFFKGLTLLRIGHVFHNIGQVKNALQYYDQSLYLAQEIEARLLLSLIHNRIGMALLSFQRLGDARMHFEDAIRFAQESGSEWLKAGPLANLASYKLAKGDLDGAYENFFMFKDIAERVGDKKELMWALFGLSNILHEMGKNEKAAEYFDQAVKIAEELGFRFRFI